MSKEEEYTTIEINTGALSEAKQLLMLSIMNEGMLRERERIVALLKEQDSIADVDALIALIKGEEDGSEPDAA
jgi:hypothetical protein